MSTKRKLGAILGTLMAVSAICSSNLSAQTCPTDATDTGVAVTLAAFRINPDGSTGAAIGSGSIGVCNCIRLRMSISYVPIGASGGKTAFFEGGTMTVGTLSASFTDDVTPAGGVPLIGNSADPAADPCGLTAVLSFLSDFSTDYCVQASDIDVNGKITFSASYVGGILHFGAGIANQPTGTTAIQVAVVDGPSCSIAPDSQEVCAGGSATFTATGSGPAGPFTFAWTGPAGFTATGETITINDAQAANAGTYTATVTDANGCTSTCTAELIVNPNPTCVVEPASQEICIGASATFTAVVSSGTAPFTITWTGPNGFTGSGTSITINNAQVADSGTYTANVVDSKGCTTSCTGELTVVPCLPHCSIVKEVACLLPAGCGTFGPTATGVKDGACPAFCYRITIQNTDPTITITSLTVNDPLLGGDISSFFTFPLAPGASTSHDFTAIELCNDTHNEVTVTCSSPGGSDTHTASADVVVLNINIECSVALSSTFDQDNNATDNHVTLPAGSVDTPVGVSLTLNNTGSAALIVTNVSGLPPLVDCIDNTITVDPAVALGLPLSIAAGGSITTDLGCWLVSCPSASFTAVAEAQADDAGGTLCVYDSSGNLIGDASPGCGADVSCVNPSTCRVTGGGTLYNGDRDTNCNVVVTTLFPLSSGTKALDHVSHGGQLGSPYAVELCPVLTSDLGNPCIRGQWQHTRHYVGKGNPKDVIDMDFHSNTPKGVYDLHVCACLGCCDPTTGFYIPGTVGVNGLCNPDDHKICGPQPRPAPDNAIIFSGIGTIKPELDGEPPAASNQAAEYVVFLVYVEDRSEPGGHHPKGAVEPADVYCFQAWKTGVKVSKKPDFTQIATDLRLAVAKGGCAFINSLAADTVGTKIGTLPDLTVYGVRAPDINDCGALRDGNQQIHPSTSATCTVAQ